MLPQHLISSVCICLIYKVMELLRDLSIINVYPKIYGTPPEFIVHGIVVQLISFEPRSGSMNIAGVSLIIVLFFFFGI